MLPSLRLLTVSLCTAALAAAGLTAPAVSPAAAAARGSSTVTVGSFNLSSVTFDKKATGNHAVWRDRRPVVAAQILGQHLDVVGVQEANQSSIYRSRLDYGVNQYMDLKGALAAQGGSYAVTNETPYNCKRPNSHQRCQHRYRGASGDDRILYNTATMRLVKQGSVHYRHQSSGKNPRYLAWAVFQSKVTGGSFFFANTHLDPYSVRVRTGEWKELISNVDRRKGSLPVVVVGDFNTSKFTGYAKTFLPEMRSAGYGDVLNQHYKRPYVSSPRAESTVNGWLNSYNGFRRDVRSYGYEDAQTKVGNGIDWVFATNWVRVQQYEVVSDVNPYSYQLQGVIPSNHNLVRATLSF